MGAAGVSPAGLCVGASHAGCGELGVVCGLAGLLLAALHRGVSGGSMLREQAVLSTSRKARLVYSHLNNNWKIDG